MNPALSFVMIDDYVRLLHSMRRWAIYVQLGATGDIQREVNTINHMFNIQQLHRASLSYELITALRSQNRELKQLMLTIEQAVPNPARPHVLFLRHHLPLVRLLDDRIWHESTIIT
jgi:hypothetical protein